MIFIGFMLVFSGLLALMSNRKHVLNMLLSLEFIILGLVWLMIMFLAIFNNYYLLLYFFVFAVCEGALGLRLIVVLIRTYGSDLLLNLGLVQC